MLAQQDMRFVKQLYWSHSVPALQGPTFARRIGTTRAISSDSATACQQLNLGGVQCCFFCSWMELSTVSIDFDS